MRRGSLLPASGGEKSSRAAARPDEGQRTSTPGQTSPGASRVLAPRPVGPDGRLDPGSSPGQALSPPRGERLGASRLVTLGEFGRAHGLSGEVRLKSYTGDPLAIAGYGPLVASDGRRFALTQVRQAAGDQPDLLVARVEGVASREAAEALNRVTLYLERERLPPPEDEDEFLLADLIGLQAVDRDGTPVGTVVAAPNYGGGDLLEIREAGGRRTALLPFTKSFVPAVEIAEGRLVVDPPDDLFEPAGRPHGS